MNRAVKNLLKYGITAAVGLLMVALTVDLHGYADAADTQTKVRILADAFTIPGVTITLFAVLVMISNEGLFWGVSYVFSYAVKMLLPGGDKTHERYGDYVARKHDGGPVRGFGFLFIVGGIFLAVAVILTVVFYYV